MRGRGDAPDQVPSRLLIVYTLSDRRRNPYITGMKRRLLPACLFTIAPAALSAQTLRGVVVDQLDRPLAGVVIQLSDSIARVRARALTNERGEFLVRLDADEQPAVAHDADGHVALQHPADAAEHLLLHDVRPSGDQVTDLLGKTLVVGHR